MSQSPILVIGATGKIGRRVAAQLKARHHDVRAVSRSTPVVFDWDDASTWDNALTGVETAFVSFAPDLAVVGAPEVIRQFALVAKEAGVRKLVLLSSRGETQAGLSEQILLGSGLEVTIVRAGWFYQNFSEGALLPGILTGVIALPAADTREPFVDADDIAEVIVAALTESGHSGEIYDVTGPRLLSLHDVAAEISAVTGNDLVYLPVSHKQFYDAVESELGGFTAEWLTRLCAEVFDGRNARLGDGVQRVLRREPRDFSDFCARMHTAGVWDEAMKA